MHSTQVIVPTTEENSWLFSSHWPYPTTAAMADVHAAFSSASFCPVVQAKGGQREGAEPPADQDGAAGAAHRDAVVLGGRERVEQEGVR